MSTNQPIPAAELKPIVDAWGGAVKFAEVLGLKSPRIVYYWLRDERNMSEPIAKLIGTLDPTKEGTRP